MTHTPANRSRQRRYPEGGGLTAEGRAGREAVRLQAGALFARDVPVAQIARQLRVSRNAVYAWRRRWLADREAGLASKGPSGTGCRLSQAQLEMLVAALQEGPAVHGFVDDSGWTLIRIADLIARRFQVRYSQRGLSILLHRLGFSPRTPKRRPIERNDDAGDTRRPTTARTWAPRGRPPAVPVVVTVDERATARSPRSLRAGR